MGELLIGQHREVGKIALDDLAHEATNIHRRKNDRRQRVLADVADHALHGADHLAMHVRRQRKIGRAACLPHRAAHHILDLLGNQVGRNDVLPAGEFLGDVAAQRTTHVLGQHDRILLALAPRNQRLEDRAHVADRYLLADQPLQHVGDGNDGSTRRHLAHQLAEVLLHLVHQEHGFLNTDELRSVALQHMRKVIGEHAGQRHHLHAGALDQRQMLVRDPVAGRVRQESSPRSNGMSNIFRFASLSRRSRNPALQYRPRPEFR